MADRPLVDKTAERLMAFILDNGYEVGQKLPNEYDLSEALGAGRSTVREAVRSLVARNILEVRQGSGTYISSKRGVVEDPFGFASLNAQPNSERKRISSDWNKLRLRSKKH